MLALLLEARIPWLCRLLLMKKKLEQKIEAINISGGTKVVKKQSLTSMELTRSRSYDASAKDLKQSQVSGQHIVLSTYMFVDQNSYCSPSDKIARYYTTSAVGLTMKNATNIARMLINSGEAGKVGHKNVVGFPLRLRHQMRPR